MSHNDYTLIKKLPIKLNFFFKGLIFELITIKSLIKSFESSLVILITIINFSEPVSGL